VTPVSQWYSNANGASFELFDEAFNPTFTLAADATGTGGMLFVRRTIGASGFIVDGNYQGTNDPQVTIQGASRTASFNMSLVGNQSVILPTDAISAAETLDEAGVASINSTNTTAMDGTVQTMTSRTITVPANGYCLVIGTAEIQVIHNNGLATTGLFGVSDAAGSIPTTQDVQLTMPAAAATGTYFVPVTVHGLFQVIAGANTFYLLGDENSGSLQFTDLQLSIVYVPTAYGTVTPSLTAGTDDVAVGMGAPVSAAAEAREAEAFHRARVEREMAAMQAQVAELQQRLEQVVAEQAVAARRKEK
jgi:hypothetical protein